MFLDLVNCPKQIVLCRNTFIHWVGKAQYGIIQTVRDCLIKIICIVKTTLLEHIDYCTVGRPANLISLTGKFWNQFFSFLLFIYTSILSKWSYLFTIWSTKTKLKCKVCPQKPAFETEVYVTIDENGCQKDS